MALHENQGKAMDTLYLQLLWQPTGPRCLYRPRHHTPPDTAAGKAPFLWMLFYDWASSGKYVKNDKAASIWIHFWVTHYPPKISSAGEKWQDLMLVLCQGKSSELQTWVFFLSDVEQDLSCLPHACLFLWLRGLVMPWSMEKKPGMSGVFVQERLPSRCAKLWATESTLWGAANVQTDRSLANEVAEGNK